MIALFISCFSNIIFKFQRGILKRLCAGEVIVGDGGMTYALERRGYVKAGPWTPECTVEHPEACLLYTSPSPRDRTRSRMPSSA